MNNEKQKKKMTSLEGDSVKGDKVGGDKVGRDKIVKNYNISLTKQKPELEQGIRDLVEEVLERLTSVEKKKYKFSKSKLKIPNLVEQIANVEKVKTIWQTDKEVKVSDFYYPTRVETSAYDIFANQDEEKDLLIRKSESGLEMEVNSIDDFQSLRNIIIQGTAGQGKSILLKYLCIQELRRGEYIPIFVELRQIDNKTSLQDLIFSSLSILGLKFDSELFDAFASAGRIALILDGFDELNSKYIMQTIRYLEKIAQKYKNIRTVISSRPNGEIQKSPHFAIFPLVKLTPDDNKNLIKKLVPDPEKAAMFLKAIDVNKNIQNVLTTPLLVTLLIIVYKGGNEIPDQLSDWYRDLFWVLLKRHDQTKPGYVRERKSELGDLEFETVFRNFCFTTQKENLTRFNEVDCLKIVSKSLDACHLKETPAEDYLEDLVSITCLLVQEGNEINFIHKSIQEYHSAKFISEVPESTSEKFYEQIENNEKLFGRWLQTLKFLEEVDPYRFKKFLEVPSLKKFLNVDKVTKSLLNKKITKSFFLEKLPSGHTLYLSGEDQNVRFGSMSVGPAKKNWGMFHYFDQHSRIMGLAIFVAYEKYDFKNNPEISKEFISLIPEFGNKEIYDRHVSLTKFLDKLKLWKEFLEEINKYPPFSTIYKKLYDSHQYVLSHEKSTDNLLDL